jgi:hypothetical protein
VIDTRNERPTVQLGFVEAVEQDVNIADDCSVLLLFFASVERNKVDATTAQLFRLAAKLFDLLLDFGMLSAGML